MPGEVEVEELTRLAAALTGEPEAAAGLVAATLADRRRPSDETGLRDRLVQRYLRRPPAAMAATELPGELAEVADRLVRLPFVDRAALVLVRLYGLTQAEVAAILDRSTAAVRRTLETAEVTLGDPYAVRATLEALSWRVPDPAVLAAARYHAARMVERRRARRRLITVAVALVILTALAVPTFRSLRPLPVRPAGDWVFALDVDLAPGWLVSSHYVTADQEYLDLGSTGGGICSVVASLPSAPAADRATPPAKSEPVWVGGRRVRYSDSFADGAGVVWSYGGAGEVTMICSVRDRKAVLAVAGSLHFSTGGRLALPVALDRLPDGYVVQGAGYEGEMPAVALAGGDGAGAYVYLATDDPSPPGDAVTLGGIEYDLHHEDNEIILCRPVQTSFVCIGAEADPSAPQELAKHLRLAPDLSDRSTWFDARAALPR